MTGTVYLSSGNHPHPLECQGITNTKKLKLPQKVILTHGCFVFSYLQNDIFSPKRLLIPPCGLDRVLEGFLPLSPGR